MTTTELIITYIFYGAIIVIGLIVLGIIRKKSKTPANSEIKQKLSNIVEKFDALIKQIDTGNTDYYKMFRQVTNIVYRIDTAVIYVSEAAERERDTTYDKIRINLENARGYIASYKFEKKSNYLIEDFIKARASLQDCISTMEGIMDRGKALKGN